MSSDSDRFDYDIAFTLVDLGQDKGRQYPRLGVSSGFLKSICDGATTTDLQFYKRKKKSFRHAFCPHWHFLLLPFFAFRMEGLGMLHFLLLLLQLGTFVSFVLQLPQFKLI